MPEPGELARFEALVLPHLDAGYNLARWLVRDGGDAEDVVQEACLRALRYLAALRTGEARPWFLKIVRNTALTWLAANRSDKVVPLHRPATDEPEAVSFEDTLVDPGDGPEVSLAKLEEARLLDGLVLRLPVEFRECLILRELEELSYREIAAIAEVPIGTVMSRLARARGTVCAAGRASMSSWRRPVACEEMALLRQAHLDGELDAAGTLAVERHLAGCPACAAEQEADEALRASLRKGLSYHQAPPGLRGAVLDRLKVEATLALPSTVQPTARSRRTLLRRAAPLAASLLVGVGLGAMLRWPRNGGKDGLSEAVLAAHLRALQPGHAIDVASTDQHTVKPWFDGKVDFAPPVRDLGEEGFQLIGGRLDYLGGRAVAVMVYRRRQHLIDLFAWPAPAEGAAAIGELDSATATTSAAGTRRDSSSGRCPTSTAPNSTSSPPAGGRRGEPAAGRDASSGTARRHHRADRLSRRTAALRSSARRWPWRESRWPTLPVDAWRASASVADMPVPTPSSPRQNHSCAGGGWYTIRVLY